MKVNKRNIGAGIALILSLSIGLFFDIKYKGMIYRAVFPKKVQS